MGFEKLSKKNGEEQSSVRESVLKKINLEEREEMMTLKITLHTGVQKPKKYSHWS